jgi:hypothetical protein
MKTIKNLKEKRWFIWAIVVVVVGLVGLTVYINNTAVKDQSEVPVVVTNTAHAVTSSVKPKLPVTQAEAETLVRNVQEVKTYMAKVAAEHGKGYVTVNSAQNTDNANSPYWVVHVYEELKGQTNTFNFYNVYSKSGVIEEQN